MTDTIQVFQRKADFFYSTKQAVHVRLRSGHWANGEIIEIKADFFMLNEREDGVVPIFFQEIVSIEKYSSKKREVGE